MTKSYQYTAPQITGAWPRALGGTQVMTMALCYSSRKSHCRFPHNTAAISKGRIPAPRHLIALRHVLYHTRVPRQLSNVHFPSFCLINESNVYCHQPLSFVLFIYLFFFNSILCFKTFHRIQLVNLRGKNSIQKFSKHTLF